MVVQHGLRCPRHVVSVLARRVVSFCVSTTFGSSQSPSRSASMYRLAICMGFVALCGGPARLFSGTGARMSHRCAPWWLLPRRAGNCDCLYRVAIAYIGLHLCRELHLSMVVLCLWWCICLWWYHICVLVYAETAVAPAKMRLQNWGPSVDLVCFCVQGVPEPHYMVAENSGSPGKKCACRIGVRVYVGQVCFAYMDNWGPSVCRFGMFLCARCARTPLYGSRKQR